MAIPYTGLFIAASCNSRFSHGRYTRSYGTVSSIGLLGQNCKPYMVVHYTFSIHSFFQPNHGDPAPYQPLGINHVHRPTHAPPAAASVNQGVSITTGFTLIISRFSTAEVLSVLQLSSNTLCKHSSLHRATLCLMHLACF
jgi:hypothetical protein